MKKETNKGIPDWSLLRTLLPDLEKRVSKVFGIDQRRITASWLGDYEIKIKIERP